MSQSPRVPDKVDSVSLVAATGLIVVFGTPIELDHAQCRLSELVTISMPGVVTSVRRRGRTSYRSLVSW